MRSHALSIVVLSSAAACAQIAGFEELEARKPDAAAGTAIGGSSAGGRISSAGKPADDGRASNGGTLGASGATSSGEPIAGESTNPAAGGASGAAGEASSASGGGGGSAQAGSAGVSGSGGSPVIGACNVNLLRNPDFEDGPAVWDYVAKNVPLALPDLIVPDSNTRLSSAGVIPRAGHYLAWLGGVLNEDGGSRTDILQQVQIPAETTKLVVSGWLQVKTTEPKAGAPYDHFEFTLDDDQDGQWFFHTWWLNPTQGDTPVQLGQWFSFSEQLEADDLEQVRGRLLTFVADAQADSENETSYWLDSLSLVASCPR
jgi:hypothetical protein